VNLHRLINTSAIRLALRYAMFYALLSVLGLGAIYWATSRFVDAQLEAGLEQELTALTRIDAEQGREKLATILNTENQMERKIHRYYLLVGVNGISLAGNLRNWPAGINTDSQVQNIWVESSWVPGGLKENAGYWPAIATLLPDGSRLLIAQRIDATEDLQEFILSIMGITLILSVALALTMGLLLGRSILKKIDAINATASAIVSGDLNQRIPLSKKNDEFDELAQHLNAMLARIEQLIIGMRRVTDNIAHDLRRPLSRLRNRLEVTLLESRDEKEYVNTMQQTITDTDGLIHTFNALLEIAQVEAGGFRGEWGQVDLSALSMELSELYHDQAIVAGKTFELQVEPDLQTKGNRHLLAQVISNLLENAIKYSLKGSHIKLCLDSYQNHPRLTISDNGPGIPSDQHELVQERFVRLESARSSTGSGLGLSLVKVVAKLHEAELQLSDNKPGLRVTLLFK